MRFTIRDVLWLMIVVGLAVGWWIDNRLNARYRVGPPKWHEMLRAVVQDLESRPDFEIEDCYRVCVGVKSKSGVTVWHNFDYKESE